MIDVQRSQPAPASLSEQKAYDGDDVKRRLREDFFAKCYLCESVFRAMEFEVDHRRPKGQFPELTHIWENLFPACHHCNLTRNRTWRDGGYLSPGAGDNLEARLLQELTQVDGFRLTPSFVAVDDSDRAACNTARELEHIHCRTRNADSLQHAIRDHYTEVLAQIATLQRLQMSGQRQTREYQRIRKRVACLVSRRAPFTMLIRSMVRDYAADLFD